MFTIDITKLITFMILSAKLFSNLYSIIKFPIVNKGIKYSNKSIIFKFKPASKSFLVDDFLIKLY